MFAMTQKTAIKAESGALGGQATLEKYGPDHFRKLAQKRKTHGGGRPIGSGKKKKSKSKK